LVGNKLPGIIFGSEAVTEGFIYAIPGLLFFALNKVLLSYLNGMRQMVSFAIFNFLRFALMLILLIIIIQTELQSKYLALLLLLIGFIIRLLFNPGLGYNDEYEYIVSAYKIFISGEQPTNLGALRMGMIVPLGLLIKVFGYNVGAFTTFMFSVSMLNILMVFKISRCLFNVRTSLVATLFIALMPIEIINSTSVLPDSLIHLFSLLSVFFFILHRKTMDSNVRQRSLLVVFSGIFCGLSYSVKETGVFLLFFLIIYLLINKTNWQYVFFLVIGFIIIVIVEIGYSQIVWDNMFARYTFQFNLKDAQTSIKGLSGISEIIRRFFIIYPFQLLFPIQKSGNLFGIYYLIASLLLLTNFRRYFTKSNELLFFVLWVATIFLFINFSIIKINPIVPLIRPQSRYLISIDGGICVILSKLIYDLLHINSVRYYKLIVFLISFSSLIYLAISINAASPTTFNNPAYYSKNLANYVIRNNLIESSDNLYCTFDVRNYLNMYTEFKYEDKIHDLHEIKLQGMNEKDIIIINGNILNGYISDPSLTLHSPEITGFLEKDLINILGECNEIYQVAIPENYIAKCLIFLENKMNQHYFSYFTHPEARIYKKNISSK